MYQYNYAMDSMTGYSLGEKLFEVTSLRNRWEHGDVHRFFLNGTPVFDVVVDANAADELRNGWIWFWIKQHYRVALKYSYLQQFLKPGFAQTCTRIKYSRLKWKLANPNSGQFQIFVLLRFEIARRKRRDYSRIPTLKMTKHAVSMALHIDDEDAYANLIKMFSVRLNDRRGYYDYLLQR